MLGTPVVPGTLTSAASSATYSVPVTVPVPPGTALVVFAGAAGATAATGVTDSQGNAYGLVASSTANEYLQAFTGTATTGLNPLAGDAWTVTFGAANAQQKNILVIAPPGASLPADLATATNGSSVAVVVAGTAASGNEIAIAAIQDANAGGAPAGWTLTPLAALSPAGQQFTSVAWGLNAAAGTVSSVAGITSAPWATVLVTLPVTPPVALGPAQAPSGGAQLPPYPVLPAPRTWAAKDKLLTPRLRADPGNALSLLANPPLTVTGQTSTQQNVPNATVTLLSMDTELVDTWGAHTVPDRSVFPSLAGWYLAEGFVTIANPAAGTTATAGIQAFAAGTGYQSDGAKVATNGTNLLSPGCADLIQVDPSTQDSIGLYCWQDSGAAHPVSQAWLKTEWVCAPSGTVVTSPVAAAGWTSGATVLLGPVAAGAVTVLVADPSGIVTGGTVSLGYGDPVQEDVTVTSVTGQTVGISACAYPHPAQSAVSVPVSAAFMNQQVRDKIRFLSYRPAARLANTSVAQTLAAQVWPAGTAVQLADPSATAHCTDNFSGWSASAPTRYTFPVSGTYRVYGQVYATDTTPAFTLSAGLAVSGGITQWGDRVLTAGGTSTESACATARRVIRVTAGQYVELIGSQSSGGGRVLKNSGNTLCKLVTVFRGL